MVSIRTHNILDYVAAATLALLPYVFGFSEVALARDVFLVVGFTLGGYSLLTDYQYSLTGIIPAGMHMTFDVVSGMFLMLAPLIYGYREDLTDFQYSLHFASGLSTIALVVFTQHGQEPPVQRLEEDEVELVESNQKVA